MAKRKGAVDVTLEMMNDTHRALRKVKGTLRTVDLLAFAFRGVMIVTYGILAVAESGFAVARAVSDLRATVREGHARTALDPAPSGEETPSGGPSGEAESPKGQQVAAEDPDDPHKKPPI